MPALHPISRWRGIDGPSISPSSPRSGRPRERGWSTSPTTPGSGAVAPDSCQRFRVTHPHHPLFNREFDLVERRVHARGVERAFFYGEIGEIGRLETIPVEWTDMAAQDPFVVLSAGQAYFRVEDLLRLSTLIESLATPSS